MRLCPQCGNTFPDDANFCPMDATRLPPPQAEAAAATPSLSSTNPPISQTLREPPLVAGRFKIAGAITPTATGELMEATDTTTGQHVMLKLVSTATLPTPALADRALREWKQLSRVQSPRVATVIDQGRAEDGRAYVATQPIAGVTLDELVRTQGPLPVGRAAAIVLQVGEALTEAQKVGVIHRDVAPRNIIVGDGDRAQLLDFGLAEPTTDKVFGTAGFVSPEQVEGRPVDQRSNIYSLGAVVYFAVTGHAPFTGETAHVLAQHLQAPPPALTATDPSLGGLDRVVQKALEKSGGRRHLTLRQFLTEIEAVSGAKAPPASAARVPAMAAKTDVDHPPAAAAGKPDAGRATVMGIASPSAPSTVQATAPATAPANPNKAAPEARTRMAEAPVLSTGSAASQQPTAQIPVAHPVAEKPAPQPVAAAKPAEKAAPVAAVPTPGAAGPGKRKGGFRETAWFKQGEIQQELAKIEAEASPDPLAPTGITGKHATVDEAAAALSVQDQKRLSLRTGGTGMMPALSAKDAKAKGATLGDRMDESEMLAEIDSSKKTLVIAVIVVVVLAAVVGLYFTVFRTKTAQVTPEKPAQVAVSPPTGAAAAPAAVPPPAPPAGSSPPAAAPNTPDKPNAVAAADSAAGGAPAPTLEASRAALKAGDLDGAVTALKGAEAAGAKGKPVKKYEAQLRKAIAQKAIAAKKRRDKAGEAAARALLAKLK